MGPQIPQDIVEWQHKKQIVIDTAATHMYLGTKSGNRKHYIIPTVLD